MSENIVTIKGLEEFKSAIQRNPRVTLTEASKFLVKSIAEYNRSIIRNPWAVGGSGGGAPVDTGNLRDTHRREVNRLSASIFPTASYAKYVHGRREGEVNKGNGVKSRPWLDYAVKSKDKIIQMYGEQMLKEIVNNLAK